MTTHIEKEIAGLKKQLATREENLMKLKQSSVFVHSAHKIDEITLEVAVLEKRLKSLTDDRNHCIRARATKYDEIVQQLSSLCVQHEQVVNMVAKDCRAHVTSSNDFYNNYTNSIRFISSMIQMTKINEEYAVELTKLRQLISEVAANKYLRQKYLDLLQISKSSDKIPSPVDIVRPKAQKANVLANKREAVDTLQSELETTF